MIGAAPLATPSRSRRVAEAFAFWGLWVGLGFALRLKAEAYLVLGVPLTAAFQLVVRRRPIQEPLVLLPVTFTLEEVSFRGLLDSHLSPEADARDWRSAVLVSAMWGLWHLPILGANDLAPGKLPVTILLLLAIHVPVGVALSLFWRRSGNLVVPGLSHAAIDAVRDALMLLRA